MSSQPGPHRSSNVDLITLAIAAVASGVAAFVTSKLWAGGTLISAAMTPVIVALVKEGIARPVDVTTRRVRDLTTGQTIEVEVPRGEAPFDPLAPVTPPPETELQPGVTLHRETRARKPWKIAIVTGLLAFVIAGAVITVPQVIANGGGGNGGGGTTYFGGGDSSRKRDAKRRDKDATPTPTATETSEPDNTATPTPDATETPTPEATETPAPTVTATPSATASPAATATAAP